MHGTDAGRPGRKPWRKSPNRIDNQTAEWQLHCRMNIVLTPRHERFISRKVKNGEYGSAEEVVRDGLRRLETDDERQCRLVWLREEVEKGFDGPVTSWTKQDAEQVPQLIAKRTQGRP